MFFAAEAREDTVRIRRIGIVGRLGEVEPKVPCAIELLVCHLL